MAVITKIEVQNDRKNDLIFILIKVKAKSTDLVWISNLNKTWITKRLRN